jgi:CPA2 family monovalent cation:H+ antiporter-2
VTKLLTELGRMGRPETPIILGVIVIEDLFIALYLAVVEPLLSESSGIEIAASFAAALAFLALFGIATKYGTGLSRRLLETDNEELLTVCTVGAVVLVAGIAEEVGVSEAIASLLFGLLIAGAGLGARIERVVTPLSDTFGAMFFFVFGTSIRPHLIVDVLPEIALGALLSFVVNVGVGMLAARGSQLSRSSGLGTGLVVLSRGEFSLILAALATTAGLDQRVEAFIAGYVLTLSLLAPILAARSDRIARRFGWFARGDPGASAPSHNPGTG